MTQYPNISLQKSFEKYDWYVLIDDCRIIVDNHQLIIPKGFTTDFASVPQFLWWLIPPHCRAAMPSIVHDYTCQYAIWPRKECDLVFKQLLIEANVPKWQYLLMFWFVRLLGWTRYNKQYE